LNHPVRAESPRSGWVTPFGLSLSKPRWMCGRTADALRLQPFDTGPRQARSLLRANGLPPRSGWACRRTVCHPVRA